MVKWPNLPSSGVRSCKALCGRTSLVVFTPGVQNHLRFGHGREDVAIQTLVAELAVEALDECILHGLSRSNEIETDAVRIRPRVHRAAHELCPVVDRDRRRRWPPLQHLAER